MNGHYSQALQWIMDNAGSLHADSLAKMVKSLYEPASGYTFSQCVANLDPAKKALCLAMCTDYVENGRTAELEKVGQTVMADYDYVSRQRRIENKEEDQQELARLEVRDKGPHRSVLG